MEFKYDVIVIGAGHAGCEAAAAAANLGSKTCLITMDMNKIGHKIVFAIALRHQRNIHAGRVFAHAACHIHTCHGNALFMSVLVGGVGHLLALQNAHGIGFCFFSHL